MNEVRVFTIEECNRLLPVLTQQLTELQKKRQSAGDLEAQIDALELICNSESKKSTAELDQLIRKHQKIVNEFYALVDQIHEHGCYLKDADLGLVDFYGMIDGRMVCLCWRLGEQQVGFWHEVNSGFTNRKPIES